MHLYVSTSSKRSLQTAAIATTVECTFPLGTVGITEASDTTSPSTPTGTCSIRDSHDRYIDTCSVRDTYDRYIER
jgi:hypothetical protein